MTRPPPCRVRPDYVGAVKQHTFEKGTATPKRIGEVRACVHCGRRQIAHGTPRRAKADLKWYWTLT